MPDDFNVTLVPVKTLSRLSMYRRYTDWVAERIKVPTGSGHGFNKMPHLDGYSPPTTVFFIRPGLNGTSVSAYALLQTFSPL